MSNKLITTTNSVIRGVIDNIKAQTIEFNYLMEEFYSPDTGFTEALARKLAEKKNQDREKPWVVLMWNRSKPEPMSHRPKLFKIKVPEYINDFGDTVPEEEAKDSEGNLKESYRMQSYDYRVTWVQSILNLDFIFNSLDWASDFEEMFTLRLYFSRSFKVVLPLLGETVIHVDQIAMGEIDKFDRLSQGTLLSIPVDMVLTYPILSPATYHRKWNNRLSGTGSYDNLTGRKLSKREKDRIIENMSHVDRVDFIRDFGSTGGIGDIDSLSLSGNRTHNSNNLQGDDLGKFVGYDENGKAINYPSKELSYQRGNYNSNEDYRAGCAKVVENLKDQND